MNSPQAITHRFASPQGRDLFEVGVSACLAHKQAMEAQAASPDELFDPPHDEPMTDEELDEMFRSMGADRARQNFHDL